MRRHQRTRSQRPLARWAVGVCVALAAAVSGCTLQSRMAEPRPAPRAGASTPAIAPWASASPGRLPGGCTRAAPPRDAAATEVTAVSDSGRAVLHARAHDAAAELRCAVAPPAAAPHLRWRWRTDSVIAGASVADPASDDAPARVFVEFASPAGPRRLYYVWDGMLTAGELVAPAHAPNHRYLVVESGADGTGRWLSYERNLQDDAVRAFGQVPGPVVAIGVLTDSDALGARTQAWYGDLTLGPAKGSESGP